MENIKVLQKEQHSQLKPYKGKRIVNLDKTDRYDQGNMLSNGQYEELKIISPFNDEEDKGGRSSKLINAFL